MSDLSTKIIGRESPGGEFGRLRYGIYLRAAGTVRGVSRSAIDAGR